MDIANLSGEAYQVITIAERFDPGLSQGFSALNRDCRNENEFLLRCKELITDIRRYTLAFFENSQLNDRNRSQEKLFPVLIIIENQIKKTMRMPPARRSKR